MCALDSSHFIANLCISQKNHIKLGRTKPIFFLSKSNKCSSVVYTKSGLYSNTCNSNYLVYEPQSCGL